MRRSLTKRIIAFSIFWIVIALLATAFLLTGFYREHIEQHFDAHVFTHVEELIAAIETTPDGATVLVREPTDPRFHRPGSGWYWEVLSRDMLLRKSPSLGEQQLDLSDVVLDERYDVQTIYGPQRQKLRAQVVHVSFPQEPGSLTFVATAPEMQISDDVKDFVFQVSMAFMVLGIGLSIAVVVQVRVALKPLKAIRSAISDTRLGKTKRLPQEFPGDVQPLVNELNFLLDHNEMLMKRARNRLGDLAHSVKNPLTVIRNYLSRARIYGKKDAIGYRTSVKSVFDDLSFAVEHIYKSRGIGIDLDSLDDKWFRGEAQDLEEMAGNLIDNAFKWARSRVRVRCVINQDRLSLVIEDDGPGIADEELKTITRRGRKLDQSKPGHGHGLAIVKDIAEIYGGSLKLDRSGLGGLRAELDLPAA
jgi:signal transduction histidine kinase